MLARLSQTIPRSVSHHSRTAQSIRNYLGDAGPMQKSPNEAVTKREEALWQKAQPRYDDIMERHIRLPTVDDIIGGEDTKGEREMEVRKKRLVYRSKQRGWLEVDLLLGTWAAQNKQNIPRIMKLEVILSISTISLAAAKDLSSAPASQPSGSSFGTHFELASVGLIGGDDSASGANWYPDWTSGDDNCKADGNAPDYMDVNSDTWLFADRTDCCTRYFGYRLSDCLGSAAASNGTNLFFPDWSGSSEGCAKDYGNTRAPAYITNQGTAYMHDSLDDCCAKHYSWNLASCLGSADTA